MANTGKLPTAAELLAGAETRGTYGSRLFFQRQGDSVLLINGSDQTLAEASGGRVRVDLEILEALTVPYVNAFIAHTGQRVEKYWRTKRYRIVSVQDPSMSQANGQQLPAVVPAPEVDILDALLQGTPADQARKLRQLAIFIHTVADSLDHKSSTSVTPMTGGAIEELAPRKP